MSYHGGAEEGGGGLDRPAYLGAYRWSDRWRRAGWVRCSSRGTTRLERRVAVKRLRPGSGDPEGRERLRREARAVAGVSHPALVQVYDVVLDPAGDAE